MQTILDNHVANQHANMAPENIMKCDDCGEEFFNEAALDYHTEITHKRYFLIHIFSYFFFFLKYKIGLKILLFFVFFVLELKHF